MKHELPTTQRIAPTSRELTKVITVRLSQGFHEALKAEAHAMKISLNVLCIAKLCQELHITEEVQEYLSTRTGTEVDKGQSHNIHH